MPTFTRHLMIPGKTDYLSLVRVVLQDLLSAHRIDSEDTDKITLAVDEALSNVIEHSYSRRASEAIGISMTLTSKTFSIVISDRGKPFRIPIITRSDIQNNVTAKRRGGYGIYLIETLMDRVSYESTAEGNRLLLAKNISHEEGNE